MPITVNVPSPLGDGVNPVLGPWLSINPDQEPAAPDYSVLTWVVRVGFALELTDANSVYVIRRQAHQQSESIPLNPRDAGQQTTLNQSIAAEDGTNVNVQVELVDQGGTVTDSGSTQAKWESTAGLQLQPTSSTTGGLTEQEHGWLQDTVNAVQRELTDITGALVQVPVSSLIHLPDVRQLLVQATTVVLTGRGTVNPPAILGQSFAYGAQLVATVPSGFGLRTGFVDRTKERIGQYRLVHVDAVNGEGLYVDALDQFDLTQTWYFAQHPFESLAFDVTVGCTVVLRWLVFSV